MVDATTVSFGSELPLVRFRAPTNDSVFHEYPWACLVEDCFSYLRTLGRRILLDEDQIDPTVFCPEIFAPVCGCDGVQATYLGGVTSWEDGPCVVVEYGGCTYPQACNYDPGAAFEDGSCTFPPEACAWPDTWAAGCTYADAENYDENAVVDNGSCTWGPCSVCVGDLDGDNVVAVTDVLLLLSAFGTSCPNPRNPFLKICVLCMKFTKPHP